MWKLKILDVPDWIKISLLLNGIDDLNYEMKLNRFHKCSPIYKRDGYYLIANTFVLIEFDNNAWISFTPENVKAFQWELSLFNHRELSLEEFNAFLVLQRAGLLLKEQKELFNLDHFSKSCNKKYFWKTLRHLN
jgi:hypothetical protein